MLPNKSLQVSCDCSPLKFDPLRVEMRCINDAGHLAVSAELTKVSYSSEGLPPLKVSVAFPLDSEQLSSSRRTFASSSREPSGALRKIDSAKDSDLATIRLNPRLLMHNSANRNIMKPV